MGVLDGLLYAVGGHDGPLVRKSVEVYNPESNQWSQVADMHRCRRNAGEYWWTAGMISSGERYRFTRYHLHVAGVVANNGKLFVIGGDDGSSNLSSVEFYNPKTDTWTILSSSMATGRSYAGVCVIDKPL